MLFEAIEPRYYRRNDTEGSLLGAYKLQEGEASEQQEEEGRNDVATGLVSSHRHRAGAFDVLALTPSYVNDSLANDTMKSLSRHGADEPLLQSAEVSTICPSVGLGYDRGDPTTNRAKLPGAQNPSTFSSLNNPNSKSWDYLPGYYLQESTIAIASKEKLHDSGVREDLDEDSIYHASSTDSSKTPISIMLENVRKSKQVVDSARTKNFTATYDLKDCAAEWTKRNSHTVIGEIFDEDTPLLENLEGRASKVHPFRPKSPVKLSRRMKLKTLLGLVCRQKTNPSRHLRDSWNTHNPMKTYLWCKEVDAGCLSHGTNESEGDHLVGDYSSNQDLTDSMKKATKETERQAVHPLPDKKKSLDKNQESYSSSQACLRRQKPSCLSLDDLEARFQETIGLHQELDEFIQHASEHPNLEDESISIIVETLRAPLGAPLDPLNEDDDEDSEILSSVSAAIELSPTSNSESLIEYLGWRHSFLRVPYTQSESEETGFLLGERILDCDGTSLQADTTKHHERNGIENSESHTTAVFQGLDPETSNVPRVETLFSGLETEDEAEESYENFEDLLKRKSESMEEDDDDWVSFSCDNLKFQAIFENQDKRGILKAEGSHADMNPYVKARSLLKSSMANLPPPPPPPRERICEATSRTSRSSIDIVASGETGSDVSDLTDFDFPEISKASHPLGKDKKRLTTEDIIKINVERQQRKSLKDKAAESRPALHRTVLKRPSSMASDHAKANLGAKSKGLQASNPVCFNQQDDDKATDSNQSSKPAVEGFVQPAGDEFSSGDGMSGLNCITRISI